MKDETAAIGGTVTEFLKIAGRSKPVLAFHFALAVSDGKLKLADFTKVTRDRIATTVGAIEALLAKAGQ